MSWRLGGYTKLTEFKRLSSQPLNLQRLYDLRKSFSSPAPWAIYAEIPRSISPEQFSVIARWSRDVVEASSRHNRCAGMRQVVEMFRDAGAKCPEVITPTAVHQALYACVDDGDIESAYAILCEAMPLQNVLQIGHLATYVAVLQRSKSWHDAIDAAEEIAAFCSKEQIWNSQLRCAFDSFFQVHEPSGSSPLTRFFESEVPRLERYIGDVDATLATEQSTSRMSDCGWGPRVSNRIRGSLLSHAAHEDIATAIATEDIRNVTRALQHWKTGLTDEANALSADTLSGDWKSAERRHWLYHNKDIVVNTSEMYHYLIQGLRTHPASVLRTLERMRDASMTPLDVSLVEGVCAASEDEATQREFAEWFLRLEKERSTCERERTKFGHPNTLAEAVWNRDLGTTLTFGNILSTSQFVTAVGSRLGIAAALRLVSKPSMSANAAVCVSSELARGASIVLEELALRVGADRALDELANVCPQLDLALLGDVPGFANYLPHREFAVTLGTCREVFTTFSDRFSTLCVIDASFIEAHENWFSQRQPGMGFIIPMSTLQDLAETACDATATPDERRRAHGGLSAVRSGASDARRLAEIMYFSEMLLLSKPRDDGNRRLVELTSNLRSLIHKEICVCAEDPQLLRLCAENGVPTFNSTTSPPPPNIDLHRLAIADANPAVQMATLGWIDCLEGGEKVAEHRDQFAEFGHNATPESTRLQPVTSKGQAARHTGRHLRLGSGLLDRARVNLNDPRNLHWVDKLTQ